MLYIKSFKNYEEFQEIFGVRVFDGRKARNNKILLSLLKDKKLFRASVKSGDLSLFAQKNLVDLKNLLIHKLYNSGAKSKKLTHRITLLGQTYYSDKYSLDALNGICEDGTPNAVRYVNHESGRVFKMKCGKFMKALIECTKFGKTLPESIVIWLCEEFNRDWQSHVIGKLPKNKLYVNDNFADIYDSSRLKGYKEDSDSFVSCMVNKGLHSFYKDSVNAKAAYLEDENGMIIARCIIFTEVFDEDGNRYRYAERQYSVGCNDVYKQALVDALIKAGEIDCYKKVGASCHDSTAIVDIHGNSLSNKRFHIDCDLDWEDSLSYQDTFKWYSMCRREADNHGYGDYQLDVTEGSLADADNDDDDDPEPDEYDDVHGCYCYEVTEVHYRGQLLDCDADRLSDFTLIDGEWYYNGDDDEDADWVECPVCGKKMPNPKYWAENLYQFELDHDAKEEIYVCSDECLEQMEDDYKEEHWYYSDYDEAHYEHEEDLTTCYSYNECSGDYEEMTISKQTLEREIQSENLFEWDGKFYDVLNPITHAPYNLEIKEAA